MREIKLQDSEIQDLTELITFAEDLEVENASTMRKQELMFAILKQLAARDTEIIGAGVVEVLQDGFGFRSADSNYLVTRTTSTPLLPDPPFRAARATRSTARSGGPSKASATSPCSRSTPSISRTRRRSATRSISTT